MLCFIVSSKNKQIYQFTCRRSEDGKRWTQNPFSDSCVDGGISITLSLNPMNSQVVTVEQGPQTLTGEDINKI